MSRESITALQSARGQSFEQPWKSAFASRSRGGPEFNSLVKLSYLMVRSFWLSPTSRKCCDGRERDNSGRTEAIS